MQFCLFFEILGDVEGQKQKKDKIRCSGGFLEEMNKCIKVRPKLTKYLKI